jgi:lipoprotein NlpD
MIRSHQVLLPLFVAALMGCATSTRAPVEDRDVRNPRAASPPTSTPAPRASSASGSGAPVVDVRPPSGATIPAPTSGTPAQARYPITGSTYTVQKGDTLLGIAVAHTVDYRDLAAWNSLASPNQLSVGQVLRVTAPEGWSRSGSTELKTTNTVTSTGAASTATTQPIFMPGAVDAKPIDVKPVDPNAPASPTNPLPVSTPATSPSSTAPIKREPSGTKVPYSDATLAQMEGTPATTAPTSPASVVAPAATPAPAAPRGAPTLGWPTKDGKVIRGFSENNKGINFAGAKGDAVLAAAAGKVILASTLRRYGKIVIVQHPDSYLTAYAHNDKLLVKEGQQVKRGDRIADMGSSDADQVMLHFEVRKDGVPVDPTSFLPK